MINMPNDVRFILESLYRAGYAAYIVGGCVRDSLMGKEPKDWDICTSATPEETEALFNDLRIIETGLKHGTVTVRLNEVNYEITTFRIDGKYTDNRRPDSVEFVADVREDLERRDFTVNAMAYNDRDGLVDPANGRSDLEKGVIRCVGNPDSRFQEDALRILRTLRFSSTYGFAIAEDTAKATYRNRALLDNISQERICSELTRILLGKNCLNVLKDNREIFFQIIPELRPCNNFAQNSRWHVFDVYEHIAHAVAAYTGDDEVIKFTLLLHDIGKPHCYTEDENGGHFHGHGKISRDIAESILDRLRLDNRSKHDILELVLFHDTFIEESEKSVRRWLNRIGPEQFRRLMEVCRADVLAQAPIEWEERLAKADKLDGLAQKILEKGECFQQKDLAVNGRDLIALGMKPGKQLGDVLRELLDAVIQGEVPNVREKLLRKALELLN